MSNRTASDMPGFVFVFVIALSMAGLITVVGMTGFQDARNVERIDNTERVLDILEDNTEDIVDRGALSRATEVKLQDANLTLNHPVKPVVPGERAGDPSVNFTDTYRVSPIIYESDSSDERVVYMFDALSRVRGDTETFVRRPPLVLTDERVLIPAFMTRPDEEATTAVGGSGASSTHVDKTINDMLAMRTGGSYDVSPTIRSPYAALWERELSSRPGVTCDDVVEPPDTCPSIPCYVNGTAHAHAVSTSVDMTFAD